MSLSVYRNLTTGLQTDGGKGTNSPQSQVLANINKLAKQASQITALWTAAAGQGWDSLGLPWSRSTLASAACGPGVPSTVQRCPTYLDALLLTMMPPKYSSASPAETGGFNFISPARAQMECASCVGFAATAAAEAAIAVEVFQGWRRSSSLSVANISFCGGITPPVVCSNGASYESLIAGASAGRLLHWTDESRLPYRDSTYNLQCVDVPSAIPNSGRLLMVDGGRSLETVARVKESIVLHGGVMTSMVIWSDFRRYPKSSPTGVYNTTRRPANQPKGPAELHAVFCYGWRDLAPLNDASNASAGANVSGGYLLCKNSWGTGWGVDGTFKIGYGAAFVLQPDYTFAMEFRKYASAQEAADMLNNHVEKVLDPAYPGCWLFRPPGAMRLLHVAEYLWRLAGKPATNITSSFDGGQTAAAAAAGVTAQQDQAGLSKLDILEDLILSNLLYNGLGAADKIVQQSAAGPNAELLLSALVGSNVSSTDSKPSSSSFLICNRTAGTGTVLSAFAVDHDDLSDCAPLVEEGPKDEFFESQRTKPDTLSQGLLPGPWRMYPWFERVCPTGHWVTTLRVSATSTVITQLLAVCDDGTELQFSQGAADSGLAPNVTSPSGGFTGFRSRSGESGVCSVQIVLSDGSTSQVQGASGNAACDTEVQLLCSGTEGERLIGFYGRTTLVDMDTAALGALGVICGKQVTSPFKEVLRTGPAGSSNDVGTSVRFEMKCPSRAFVTEIKGWSSGVLDGLVLSCSDGTVLRPFGGNQTGSPVTATSSQGFTRITAYVALEEQNIPELEIPPFNVTRVVGLAALDSRGTSTSWGASSSTVGAFNESILSCDAVSGGGRLTAVFGTVLMNLYVDDPSTWSIESFRVACGGTQKCEYGRGGGKRDSLAALASLDVTQWRRLRYESLDAIEAVFTGE
eukprot:gene2182-2500_t